MAQTTRDSQSTTNSRDADLAGTAGSLGAKAVQGSTLRDPHEWKTGDEPMTTAQRSYLETLTREAGEDFDPNAALTKADAALRIEELQRKTGRGAAGQS